MPNSRYLAGRRLEWLVQKKFKDAGFIAQRSAGSHGLADLFIYRSGGCLDITKPITISEIDEVLNDWIVMQDREQVLENFLYGRRKYLARGGEQRLHLSPVSAWIIQAKSTKKGTRS